MVTVTRIRELTLTRFLAFGDSITGGEVTVPLTGILPESGGAPNFRLQLVPSAAYPSVLADLMRARYTAQRSDITMANEGQPGEHARDPPTLARLAQLLLTERPEVVLIMHGYNDVANAAVIRDAANAVNAMAAEARNRQARVFLASLVPPRPGLRSSRPTSNVTAYNDRLREVARGEDAVFVDLYTPMLADVDIYIGIDGLHPTEAGYRKMAELFFEAVRAELEVP